MVLMDTFLDDINAQLLVTLGEFFDFMPFGDDNTAPVFTDTALGNQIGSNPTFIGVTIPNIITIDGHIYSTNGNTEDLVEIGFDDTQPATDIKSRSLITSIAKRSHRHYLIESLNIVALTQS